jgi:hypothetical protein
MKTYMIAIIEFFKKLLGPLPPADADERCPHCLGLGYDSSGFTCSCLREKK